MHRARRVILTLYLGLVVLACTWVPWKASLPQGREIPLGYSSIWSPSKEWGGPWRFAKVDVQRVALEILALTALCGIGLLMTPDRKERRVSSARAVSKEQNPDSAKGTPDLSAMEPTSKVLVGPARTNGSVSRIVETSDGKAFTETWDGSAWVRGGATIGEVLRAPPASTETMNSASIPAGERTAGELD